MELGGEGASGGGVSGAGRRRVEAYDKQREEYKNMIEQMLKEGEGLLVGLTPEILVKSMVYFATASAVVYQSIGDWLRPASAALFG